MKTDDVDTAAKVVWNYLQLHEEPRKSDAIFCLCSFDTRVAVRAAELMLGGMGEYLIFSGGFSSTTRQRFSQSEADTFAHIAMETGVPRDKIIIENKSTNTGENIQFTYDLLQTLGLQLHSFLLVQKPYMERRTYATFKKQWPNQSARIGVTSPQIPYDNYFNDENPKELVINTMVGDMQRIREYPKLGYQIEQEIPQRAWEAYEKLISLGFGKHLIK